MRSTIYYCIIFLLFFSNAIAQPNGDAPSLLDKEVGILKKDAGLKNASWGLFVIETETGKQLCSYNADIVLEPASVMKVVSTGAALSLLGPSYVFETTLEYSGTIDSAGNLNGNLYIKGSGDPTIGSTRFDKTVSTDSIFSEFYAALKQNNIRHINGFIVADAAVFEESPASGSWLWEDIGNYYASGAYGINVFENSYRLYFDAGAEIGSPAELTKMSPVMNDITFINNVTTGSAGSGDNVIIYGQPYTYLRMLEGTVPLGKTDFDVDGSIPDPPKFFAELLNSYIKDKGILVGNPGAEDLVIAWNSRSDTAHRTQIAKHLSPKLSEIIKPTNLKSVNLFAEVFLKTMGKVKKNEGSEKSGIEVVKQFWASKNIDLSGFEMEDGCGLSRKNKISTRQLCDMLKVLAKEKTFAVFIQSLPVAGKSGGMASLLKNTMAENNLKAKTGNMDKIKSYAGYVTNAGGKLLAFAMIFNNYTCSNAELKQKSEKLMLLISQTK